MQETGVVGKVVSSLAWECSFGHATRRRHSYNPDVCMDGYCTFVCSRHLASPTWVTGRVRCSPCPTEPVRATRATSTGDGRLPAGCQQALGCLPGRYAVDHFAHEAGTKVPAGRCRRWVLLNVRVEGVCWLGLWWPQADWTRGNKQNSVS